MRPVSSIVAGSPLAVRVLRRTPPRWLRALPDRVSVPLVAARRHERANVEDVVLLEGPGVLTTSAYWLTTRGDEGPAASVFYGCEEILRVDVLATAPHVHYGFNRHRGSDGGEGRVYLPPVVGGDAAARVHHELAHNLPVCLGSHPRRAVRQMRIDQSEAEAVAGRAARHLDALVATRVARA
ncbi:hypothetical protein PO878_07980 [Iamia majanohamensis]|uniref:Uncharacterized protein n=1 Tax=Iamia majanohamensis TaxID=467976 RepID=A0AAE9YIM4_9ACTN|nr:hypothetical protein [Iamia majanohamensis]WCO68666.1 hypothetical protein PO878_07980 [Iamia majanohamensis]